MSLRVRFTAGARTQFLSAVTYIRAENPPAARRFRDRVEEGFERIREYPESGHHLPEFPDLPHRELIVRPYRFFYRVSGDRIWIVGVWHSRQLASAPEEEG